MLVRISLKQIDAERIETLGHELQHAAEVAGARGIVSDATLRTYYENRGLGCGRAYGYETVAAIKAQSAIRAELQQNEASDPTGCPDFDGCAFISHEPASGLPSQRSG